MNRKARMKVGYGAGAFRAFTGGGEGGARLPTPTGAGGAGAITTGCTRGGGRLGCASGAGTVTAGCTGGGGGLGGFAAGGAGASGSRLGGGGGARLPTPAGKTRTNSCSSGPMSSIMLIQAVAAGSGAPRFHMLAGEFAHQLPSARRSCH